MLNTRPPKPSNSGISSSSFNLFPECKRGLLRQSSGYSKKSKMFGIKDIISNLLASILYSKS